VRGLRSGEIARIMKTAGYDWLFIDLEHGPSSVETAFTLSIAALDAGIVPIVRVPAGELVLAARCLDGGALGVFISHVDSVENAQAAVKALRFPPLGHRSVGGSYPQLGFRGGAANEVIPAIEQATLLIVNLETPTAIRNAAAIAAVPGIDGVVTVAEAARAAGAFAGFGGVYQPELMKKYIGLGMRMILCGSDISLLLAAAQERARFVRGCAP
jgi:2-keto-3-deoxy-L-rhamnonate aldolase RhmA